MAQSRKEKPVRPAGASPAALAVLAAIAVLTIGALSWAASRNGGAGA